MTGPAVFLGHTAAPSGAELATLRLLRTLRAHGTEVALVSTEDGPVMARARDAGIDTRVVTGRFDSRAMTTRSGPLRLITGFLALLRLGWTVGATVRDLGARVLVAESTKALVLGAVAARRARVPLVWQVHDRVSRDYFGLLPATTIRLLAALFCRGLLANSHGTRATLPVRIPAVVAYPGVALPATPPPPRTRAAAEAVVVVVGRLSPWKGQDVFLRALAAVPTRPAAVYLVGGTFFDEQPFRRYLEQLADELGLAVTFTGHVDDPDRYLAEADVLVHCSVLPEPFGQVVVEGMAAGCAVIATAPGGPAEIIADGRTGRLVPAGDEAALTAALTELLGDPAARARIAAAGADRARDFDIDTTARVVTRFLDEVAPP
ncbi:glycosyltransferase family 4 protein [Nocardia exalbida]|uniref:glycosyltransferase family 4 protein n=1 Tax=Nocardia exalbida TaxID=290231 RepID=UPI0002F47485|nr:glycosyltransferase family 4 protein [Nocardia exalbida]